MRSVRRRYRLRPEDAVLLAAAFLFGAAGLVDRTPRSPTPISPWQQPNDDATPPPTNPVMVETLDRDTIVLGATKPWPAVIVRYSTSCPHCRSSVEAWRELSSTSNAVCERGIAVLSLEPLDTQRRFWSDRRWAGAANCETPIVGKPLNSSAFNLQLPARGVPSHYVLSEAGTTTHVWVGALRNRRALGQFTDSIP